MRADHFAAIEDLGLVDNDRTEDMRVSAAEEENAGDRPAKNEVTGSITTPHQE